MNASHKDIKKLLNINIVNLLNSTISTGEEDFPKLKNYYCADPNYLVLYQERAKYKSQPNNVICFYSYDLKFDGINGLFNAIYYDDKPLLKEFKGRFNGCKYFIAPDFSQVRTLSEIENKYRYFKMDIVSLWLTLEMNAMVYPNVTFHSRESFKYMLVGYEECEVVAISCKGLLKRKEDRNLLVDAVKYTVDYLKKNLKMIIVYSVSKSDEKIFELFEYATINNIKVVIPPNTLQIQNKRR